MVVITHKATLIVDLLATLMVWLQMLEWCMLAYSTVAVVCALK